MCTAIIEEHVLQFLIGVHPTRFSCCKLPASKERVHVQVHEGVVIHAEGGVVGLAALVHLLMVAQVGLAGKALVALQAGERLLFGVDASVADELRGHAERLSALQTLVAFGLRVDAAVVLQGHQVGELFLAHGAEEEAGLVAVLVVEQGAGVTVCAAAVLADVALFLRVCADVAVQIRNALWDVRQRGRNLPAQPVHRHGPISSRAPARGGSAPVCSLMVAARSLVVRLLVLLVAGRAGKALLADAADDGALLHVHVHVALEVCDQTEGLAALGAAVAFHLGVHL